MIGPRFRLSPINMFVSNLLSKYPMIYINYRCEIQQKQKKYVQFQSHSLHSKPFPIKVFGWSSMILHRPPLYPELRCRSSFSKSRWHGQMWTHPPLQTRSLFAFAFCMRFRCIHTLCASDEFTPERDRKWTPEPVRVMCRSVAFTRHKHIAVRSASAGAAAVARKTRGLAEVTALQECGRRHEGERECKGAGPARADEVTRTRGTAVCEPKASLHAFECFSKQRARGWFCGIH